MKESILMAKIGFSLIGGVLGFMFGKMDGLILALVFFVSVDYITGIICAWAEKRLSSETGAKGIAKKVFIFCLVAVANIIDTQILRQGAALRTAVIFYYLANEGLSITENAAILGVPIPKRLRAALEQLNEEDTNDPEREDSRDSDVV